tara:strand:- start:42 stop:770 length:729 start_codon:yes stop_codon:yes gene_type:complete
VSYYIQFIDYKYISGINPIVWNENGIVENLQIFFLIIATLNLFIFLKKPTIYKTSNFFIIFIYIYFIGLLYFFFEEISWGQHLFNWESPAFFENLNQQKETNFHNISNIFNEVPRTMLAIWCSLSFIAIKKMQEYKNLKLFVFPEYNLRKISFIILIVIIPDLILKKFNLYVEYPHNLDYCPSVGPCFFYPYPIEFIQNFEIFALITFNFLKLSEFQELLFTYYILVHSFYIKKLKFIKNSS